MELTLAIITKNRLKSLGECLSSVFKQSCKEFKVLIIDNDQSKSALPLFEQFQSLGTIPMEYVGEPAVGYAFARNCAIENCRTQYLGFIDDDCILNPDWVQNGLAAVKRHKSAFVAGLSQNSVTSDIYTQVECFITQNWWKDSYNTDTFEIKANRLDTKNVILDRSLLVKNNIYFDEGFNRYGGEDCDLGIQLQQKGFIGYYVPEMVLLHNEVS
ncbi:MAG TPA: glycosyltransferase family 2 protein, partial [Clostridia bacterium]|nr:glycosyltransferase family 2 protein [Clostridia bacterium]